ncbi:MAG: hypothetical protein WCA13_10970 [Terriglobales bacterium]
MNDAAAEALVNAMYRYTFGIVGDGGGGSEGRGLGTGVGLVWKNTYLIVTAAHAMQSTPYERLSFLLPDESVHFADSDLRAEATPIAIRKRFELEKPKTIIDDNHDLAAFILEKQEQERGQRHFYQLDDHHTAPTVRDQVGVVGYPGATKLAIGEYFMPTPYWTFGELHDVPPSFDVQDRISMSYPIDRTVDAHGLSGCGMWISNSCGAFWSASVSLIGITTDYEPSSESLIGYKVESVIHFLQDKEEWIN